MRRETSLLAVFLAGCALSTDPASEATCPEEQPPVEYERRDWGRWTDEDGDCQDTRQEVLVRDSSIDVTLDEDGCRVLAGRWIDPYDGSVVTDPSKIDVDHLVALHDAHVSGGWQWSYDEKILFTNDLSNLKATSQSTNRSKGARGPDEWLPPLATVRCAYIREWSLSKERHDLALAPEERAVIDYMAKTCDRGEAPGLPQL